MYITVYQLFIILVLILIVILLAFKMKGEKQLLILPADYKDLLRDYVKFYGRLSDPDKEHFEKRVEHFYAAVPVTGVNAEVEDLDRILIAAAAIIPVFSIKDWQYINLDEVLIYPGTFNQDYEQGGAERQVTGMVGTGAMNNKMILTKWQLRQGFINDKDSMNTAIHEFVHLIDKMDGTMDGVPEIILERKYVKEWKQLMETTIQEMKNSASDIHIYGATSPVEFFAVIAEYFFEQPELLKENHPELYWMLVRIFKTDRT